MKKIKTLKELEKIVKTNVKVVLTNGCFSFVHPGHLHYLEWCKSQGKTLIVCVNSDKSINDLKGYDIMMDEKDRTYMLSCLEFVDYVHIFETSDITNILKVLKPKIYVKGGDYNINTINQEERKIIEGYGGKILFSPKKDGYSSKNYISKIKQIDLWGI